MEYDEEYYDCVLGALAEASGCEAAGDAPGAANVLREALKKTQEEPPFDEAGALYSEEDPPLSVALSVGWNRLAGRLIQAGVLSEAQDALESSLKLWPRNALALLNLGDLHFIYGEIALARDAYASIVNQQAVAVPGTWQYDWVTSPLSDCLPIARYLLALVLHQIGDYDAGAKALQSFGCTRRLSPELWRAAKEAVVPGAASCDFAELVEEAWPVDLNAKLKQAFAADAPFWRETDYGQRGYYSFWNYDGDDAVSTLIRHIQPLAEAFLKDEQEICGAEWWVHTKPAYGRSMGHQLHFDTEESMSNVVHPLVSTVCYLDLGGGTGDDDVTVVLDQQRESTTTKTRAVVASPVERGCLLFKGDRLHGVLPAPRQHDRKRRRSKFAASRASELPQRLTLMVGFWAIDVPKERRRGRFDSCAPMPRFSRSQTWPRTLEYRPAHSSNVATQQQHTRLRAVQSAWETLTPTTMLPHMVIPEHIDRHFFVRDEPQQHEDDDGSSSEEEAEEAGGS